MLVDPDRSIVWANDAALAAHGVSERAALGETIDACIERFPLRARNNRRLVGESHPLERLAAGEAFDQITVERLDADGAAAAVLRLRGLVLADEAGQPDALVLVIHDVTEVFDAEQRFERTFNANPAPAVICRLADLRYVKVNPGFLAMTGYRREQIIGASAYEIDMLDQAADRDLALERLRAGAPIPQMEVTLRLPGGGTKLAMAAGQPLDLGTEACMLLTFIDLEPRRRAEAALRRSQERFEKAFRLAPVPTCLMAQDTLRLLDANDAFVTLSGHAREAAIGRTPSGLALWAERAGAIDHALAAATPCRGLEVRLRAAGGEIYDCLLWAEKLRAAEAPEGTDAPLLEQDCVLAVLQDITARRRSELDLMTALEAVLQDTTWFSRTIAEKVANLRQGGGARAPMGLGDLTRREREALELICRGLKDGAIATELGLRLNTVRNHVASLYAKIGVHSRAEAIIWGRERGVVG